MAGRATTWRAAVAALAGVGCFVCLLSLSSTLDDGQAGPSRRLLAKKPHFTYMFGTWGIRHIVGLVLSILVSLTSSVDRECGSSLYMVLFAALLDMPFRQAAAMTAFTVALGALGPGIASMSEAHITERGILAIVDYAGALVLLPTMFWGISFGVIANLILPNWSLALLWVVTVLASNIDLSISLRKYLTIKREARAIGRQLAELQQQCSEPAAHSTVELSACAVSGRPQRQHHHHEPGSPRLRETQLLARAHELTHEAKQVEAAALLYPVLFTPSVQRALRVADVEPAPNVLSIGATPSVLTHMDRDHLVLEAELPAFQTTFGRFTLAWGRWKRLNNHFELSMVLKVVVMHLVCEALRHHFTKPCTTRYWIMSVLVSGLTTCFLTFTVVSYTKKRLWRGPHWVSALEAVRQLRRQAQQQELAELCKDCSDGDDATLVNNKDAGVDARIMVTGVSPAHGKPVSLQQLPQCHVRDVDDDASSSSSGTDRPDEQPGCGTKLRRKLPWFWGPADAAITNISDCNSYNQYRNWRLPVILLCAAGTLPIGILGCALGLPGGPLMSHMLLALGLKPRVVAGTSRFLVLCFTFGSFVAHVITGNLEPTLAAAFGLLNLGLAPLGMLLFTRLRPRGIRIIIMSLLMGLAGLIVITLGQLVPLLSDLAGRKGVAVGHLAPAMVRDAAASMFGRSNTFDVGRFCHEGH